MTGRKTIMVEEPVWKKIDTFKHRICTRSIGEAIEEAINCSSSRKYFASIHQDEKNNYLVESVGRTKEETIRNLLIYDEDYLGYHIDLGDLWDEADVEDGEDCHFIIECTMNLYYEYLLFAAPNRSHGLICCSCQLKGKRGERVADTKTFMDPSSPEIAQHYALLNLEKNLVEIVGNSAFQVQAAYIDDEYQDPMSYNPANFKLMRCKPRYYVEYLMSPGSSNEPGLYRIVKEDDGEEVIDTTPEGKYYAVVSISNDEKLNGLNAIVRGVGLSATSARNNVVQNIMGNICPRIADKDGNLNPHAALIMDKFSFRDLGHMLMISSNCQWKANENQTEWKQTDSQGRELIIMECTKEVYAQTILSKWYENSDSLKSFDEEAFELEAYEPVICRIEDRNGVRVAC